MSNQSRSREAQDATTGITPDLDTPKLRRFSEAQKEFGGSVGEPRPKTLQTLKVSNRS